MRNILLLFFISVLGTSCSSTYFFSTLSSVDNDIEQVDNGDFLIEKDSLWIAYCFNGKDAPIQITVFNKSTSPLYIDWQRSALIIDNRAISYTGNIIDNANIYDESGEYIGDILDDLGSSKSSISFIPPGTMVSKKPLYLVGVNYDNIRKKDYKETSLIDKDGEVISAQRIDFTDYNTPLKFRSYLTIYADKDKPMVFEQEFFLANIIKSKELTPKTMDGILADRGDLFYIQKEPNTTGLDILLGTTLIVGSVALDVLINAEETY